MMYYFKNMVTLGKQQLLLLTKFMDLVVLKSSNIETQKLILLFHINVYIYILYIARYSLDVLKNIFYLNISVVICI